MNGQVTAKVEGWELNAADVRVSVTERASGTSCVDLNGTATLNVYAGPCIVQMYATPDQLDKLAGLLKQAAHEARCIAVGHMTPSEACAELARLADEQRRVAA